ncbi:MAG TPA: ethanolamine utilization microcompartment protein EutL [Polyangia bacterium]|nr:ethanolamine utilization microcompartment protein EutL [Polyangia bacterium]
MKFDLPPLKPRALAVRAIPDAAPDLARVLELPAERRALGIVTATSDDALFTALDQGTKASPAEVVYAKSFYAGAAHPSGPLSGECIGIYAARDPAEIEAALTACLAYLENEAWFYGVTLAGAASPVAFYPHVVASVGRHLAAQANVRVGSALAYLIAPPLESVIGLDAACKAGRVRVAKWFGPPSETNFGGALLAGDLPACEAAARAFADAIVDVCGAPLRGDPRVVAAAGKEADLSRLPQTVADGRFRALETGERFAEKPDHLTHLRDDDSLVPKTHPRIVARGKLDLLQSALLDAQVVADADGARALVGELGEVLELARALVGAEVTDRAVPPPTLWGMTADQIRDATHHTRELYGVPFMYPDVRQGPVVAKLSLARAIAREAEVAALLAFPPGGSLSTATPGRPDLTHALNRISSALYLLAVRYVAGQYQGGRRPLGPVRGWRPADPQRDAKPDPEKAPR